MNNIAKPIVLIEAQLFSLELDTRYEISLISVSCFKKIYSYIPKCVIQYNLSSFINYCLHFGKKNKSVLLTSKPTW